MSLAKETGSCALDTGATGPRRMSPEIPNTDATKACLFTQPSCKPRAISPAAHQALGLRLLDRLRAGYGAQPQAQSPAEDRSPTFSSSIISPVVTLPMKEVSAAGMSRLRSWVPAMTGSTSRADGLAKPRSALPRSLGLCPRVTPTPSLAADPVCPAPTPVRARLWRAYPVMRPNENEYKILVSIRITGALDAC